jgi:hypothetical protein
MRILGVVFAVIVMLVFVAIFVGNFIRTGTK